LSKLKATTDPHLQRVLLAETRLLLMEADRVGLVDPSQEEILQIALGWEWPDSHQE